MNKKKRHHIKKTKRMIRMYKRLDRDTQTFVKWCFSKKDCTYNEYIKKECEQNERLSNIIKE